MKTSHRSGMAVRPAAPRSPTLFDGRHAWTDTQVRTEAQRMAKLLGDAGTRVLASLLDNSVAWVVADLAAALAGVVHLPLPTSLTRTQLAQALRSATADAWLTTPLVAQHMRGSLPGHEVRRCELAGDLLALVAQPPGMPRAARAEAGGQQVRPDPAAMQCAAEGLMRATATLGITRHLCVLPLTEPLERVAGLKTALARGADCVVLPLHQVGLTGTTGFDAAAFHAAVLRHEPHSMVLRPALLRAWSAHLHATRQSAPRWLRLVLVAGPAVGDPARPGGPSTFGLRDLPRGLMEAHAAGIPAYEGYAPAPDGLLQTLNLPGADLPGSAGRVLPHAQLRCTALGEIEVAEPRLADQPAHAPGPVWRPTGDLGRIDAQGFLHLADPARDTAPAAAGPLAAPDWAAATLRGGPCLRTPVSLQGSLP
ncbi:MAG TPA: AMP-binding protein [Burkholderiaceae bacterium]|nr:AMP-binding protein [Burkholderiaceae bacterium]